LVTIVNKDTLAEAPTKDAATTTAVASTQHHATSSIGGFSTWQNRVAATVLAVPGNTQDLYKAGANIILILAVLAIVWLILKEYVLYTKHVPSEERVGRTRLLFFAIGSFIAAVGMMFSATPFAVLPLLALAIILVVMIFAQGKTASMVSVGQAKHVPGSNQARNPMVPMKAQTSILAQNTDNKGAPQKAK
jgi:hypothetical protein